MLLRRAAPAGIAVLASLTAPATAAAHGIQGRADVPVPLIAFYWAAAVVLVVSFVALAAGWKRPVLAARAAPAAPVGRAGLRWVLGAVSFALLALVFATAAFGSEELNDNPAPIAVFVVWWILAPVIAAFGPDLWRLAHPVAWLARLLRIPERREAWPAGRGVWLAVAGLAVFIWLELVYPTAADVRLLALLVAGWTIVTLAGMATWGIETWLDRGEPFAVYTGLFHQMSPLQGARRRTPVVGLTRLRPVPGTVTLVALLIGSVSYDGLSRTAWWKDRVASASADLVERGVDVETAQQLFGTFGLVAMVLLALGAFLAAAAAARAAGRLPRRSAFGGTAGAFAHSLVPIALAYVLAHYVSYVWYQSQRLIPLVSDPFGSGADLFGTADFSVDYTTLSATATWAVQIGAIVLGHVLGLVLAHDRALEIEAAAPGARGVRSQWPMLALMVIFTVGGLYFLSEGLNA